MKETARRAFLASTIFVGVVALALALWKLRLLLAVFFFGLVIAAAMRPGVEALARYHIPRVVGVLLHYLALAGAIGILLWQVLPIAQQQISHAVPTSKAQLNKEAKHSHGIKHTILVGIKKRLKDLPSGSKLIHTGISATKTAFEVLIGIFIALATGAYWIFERDRAERLVLSLLPRSKRRTLRETWTLIDAKLGAYVRGQLLLVCFVATVLSFAFWIIGMPFWLLVGIFAGLVELIPVVGPLAAGVVAVGVGLTQSWQVALAAGIVVLSMRLLEDYVVIPKVLGDAVGLTPLTVLFAVASVTIIFGSFSVLLAIPFAAVIATAIDVIVLKRDPGEAEQPTVLFPAKDAGGEQP
jgi:predicted PurR-regulated permease PerM